MFYIDEQTEYVPKLYSNIFLEAKLAVIAYLLKTCFEKKLNSGGLYKATGFLTLKTANSWVCQIP